MSRQITELETILQQCLVEHRKLLAFLESQQDSMKMCDLKKMDDITHQADSCRVRLMGLEQRRRQVVGQLAAQFKISGDVTLKKLAAAFPQRADALLKLRTELKAVADQVRTKAYVAGRVAGAVMGHLNTVARLIAGSVGKAGVYTKRGLPRMASRVGVIEAVG
jgi:ABC-type phosphate transport system auxiliary subunit